MNKIDEQKEEELLKKHEHLIYFICNKYKSKLEKVMSPDDIYQEGRISALKAIRNYDETKGYELTTYMSKYITNKMLILIRKYYNTKKHSIYNPAITFILNMDSPINEESDLEYHDVIEDKNAIGGMNAVSDLNKCFLWNTVKNVLSEKFNKRNVNIFITFFLENKTYDDIGNEFNLSRQRVFSIIKTMSKYLKENCSREDFT